MNHTQDVFKENNTFQKFPKRKQYESDTDKLPERKGKKGSYSVLRGLKRLEE